MRKTILSKLLVYALFFCLFLGIGASCADDEEETIYNVEVVNTIKPKPHSISPNVVFVVDGSSSINRSPEISQKFDRAWATVTNLFASDQFNFCVYVFHNEKDHRFYKWTDASGPMGLKELHKAKAWIKNNTGVYSWGLKSIRLALRQKNPLDKNPATRDSVTLVLITDGGLTEAARNTPKVATKNWDWYAPVNKAIAEEQKARKAKKWEEASIVCVGMENTDWWSPTVKRPDDECQAWLRKIGKLYGGGYFNVRLKKTK